ncbi:MAG: peptidylprolyl isomerase [Phenylobacterium sp.]
MRPTRRRQVRRCGLAAALALAAAGCSQGGGEAVAPEAGDVTVATVANRPIWSSDVRREALAQGLIGEREALDPGSDMFRRVLEQVIDQRLLAAEAERRGLDKPAPAQRRLAAARERTMADLLVERVVADAVDDKAVKSAYQDQLLKAPRSEEIHGRQILLASAAQAEDVKKLLAQGAAFEALALERSRDAATRFNGGDLGYFTLDVMPQPYQAALQEAKAGQIVGPFQVEEGFAVVKVEDRRAEAPISLEAARPQIVRFLTYGQIRELIESLRDKARKDGQVKYALRGAQAPGRATPPADAPAATAPKSEGAKP